MRMCTKISKFSHILKMLQKKGKVSSAETAERREQIQAALRAVMGGEAIRKAAKSYGVPYSTLPGHVTGEPNTCNKKQLNKHFNISHLFLCKQKIIDMNICFRKVWHNQCRQTNSFDTCRGERNSGDLPGFARVGLWLDKGNCYRCHLSFSEGSWTAITIYRWCSRS